MMYGLVDDCVDPHRLAWMVEPALAEVYDESTICVLATFLSEIRLACCTFRPRRLSIDSRISVFVDKGQGAVLCGPAAQTARCRVNKYELVDRVKNEIQPPQDLLAGVL